MKFFILLLFISPHVVFGADKHDLQLKNVEIVVLPERLHRDISQIVSTLIKDDYFLENYTKSLRIGEDSKKSKSIKELIFNNDQDLYHVYTNTVIKTLNPNIKDLNVVRNGQKIRLLDIPIKFEGAVSLLGVTSSSVSDIAVTNAVKKYNKLGETKELENIIKNASSNVVNLKFDKMVELNNKFESEYYKDSSGLGIELELLEYLPKLLI